MLDDVVQHANVRGWNIYEASEKEDMYTFVPRGPVTELSADKHYMVLPRCEASSDPESVLMAMKATMQSGRVPLATWEGRPIAFAIFKVEKDEVTLQYDRHYLFSHAEFRALAHTVKSRYDA